MHVKKVEIEFLVDNLLYYVLYPFVREMPYQNSQFNKSISLKKMHFKVLDLTKICESDKKDYVLLVYILIHCSTLKYDVKGRRLHFKATIIFPKKVSNEPENRDYVIKVI